MKLQTLAIAAAGLAVVVAGAYIAKKGIAGAAAGAVGAVADAASGIVVGIGEVVGIPATNEAACDAAIRDGRTWDASFACSASRFAGYLRDKLTSSEGASGRHQSNADGAMTGTTGGSTDFSFPF